MFRDGNSNDAKGQGSEGVLRLPDGNIDFDAYRAAARRERAAAIENSMRETTRVARATWSALRARLTPAGKPAPVGGKRHAGPYMQRNPM